MWLYECDKFGNWLANSLLTCGWPIGRSILTFWGQFVDKSGQIQGRGYSNIPTGKRSVAFNDRMISISRLPTSDLNRSTSMCVSVAII